MHSTRSLNGIPFWCLIAVLGTDFIWRKKDKIKFTRTMFIGLFIWMLISVSQYIYNYFGEYQKKIKSYMGVPWISALEYSFDHLQPNETLYISDYFFPDQVNSNFKPYWYAVLLFLGKIDPVVYQKHGIPHKIIFPYCGQKHLNNGILLTSNIQPVKINNQGKLVFRKNNKMPPKNSILLKTVNVKTYYNIYIYHIKQQQ